VTLNRRLLLATAAPALLAACASPATHYYRLAVIPGPVNDGAAAKIRVRNINVPAALRQDGIPKPGGAYQVNVFANDVWAGPFDTMLQDATVQELAQRLPAAEVVRAGGAITAPADMLVEANVQRFDPDSTGQITLTVQIAIKSGTDFTPWLLRTFSTSAAPAGADVVSIVATMSTLWAGVMDQIAPLIAVQWRSHPPANG
jgi:uncharacterized lipoprotein YmbA